MFALLFSKRLGEPLSLSLFLLIYFPFRVYPQMHSFVCLGMGFCVYRFWFVAGKLGFSTQRSQRTQRPQRFFLCVLCDLCVTKAAQQKATPIKHRLKSAKLMTKFYLFINRKQTTCMIHSSIHHYKTSTHDYQHGLSLLELTIVLLILMALASLTLPSFTEVPRYAQCTATKSTMKAIRDALLGGIDGPGYVADVGDFPATLDALFNMPANYCTSNPSIITLVACTADGGTWQTVTVYNPVTGRGWRGPYLQESIAVSIALTGNFALNTHVNPSINVADSIIPDSFSNGAGIRNPIIIQNPGDDAVPDGNDCSVDVTGGTDPNECYRLVSAGADGILDTPLADANVSAATRADDLVLYLGISEPTAILPANDQTGCILTD